VTRDGATFVPSATAARGGENSGSFLCDSTMVGWLRERERERERERKMIRATNFY
jgi:hypothetical protein